MIKRFFAASLMVLVAANVGAQSDTSQNKTKTLEEVSIQQRKSEGVSRLGGAVNGLEIGQDELFRAACCNLGESFITNPSVDVNYNDAAVGARQIKLLGTSRCCWRTCLSPSVPRCPTNWAMCREPG